MQYLLANAEILSFLCLNLVLRADVGTAATKKTERTFWDEHPRGSTLPAFPLLCHVPLYIMSWVLGITPLFGTVKGNVFAKTAFSLQRTIEVVH